MPDGFLEHPAFRFKENSGVFAELETVCVSVVGFISASDNTPVHAEIPDLPLKMWSGFKMKKNVISNVVECGCGDGTSAATDVVESFRGYGFFIGKNKKRQ